MNETTKTILRTLWEAPSHEREEFFKYSGDTYRSMKWQDFVKFVEEYGFTLGYKETVPHSVPNTELEGEEVIFFLPEKGLILYAESYDGIKISQATIFGEISAIKASSNLTISQMLPYFSIFMCVNYAVNNRNITQFQLNAVDGIRYQLDMLLDTFELSKTWQHVPEFMWLTSHADKGNFAQATNQKIHLCPPEVHNIVYGNLEGYSN